MLVALHQLAAALYLVSGVSAGLDLTLPGARARRVSLGLLAGGAVAHLASFAFLHWIESPPALTELPAATSLTACLAVVCFLAFASRARRARWEALVVWIAPVGFLGAFTGALLLPSARAEDALGSGSWPHAHVLLASAGLAFLAVAGVAGLAYLREARALKAKRPASQLPSLEALDRVNVVSLALGFLLLSLGVVSGMIWLASTAGRPWTGSAHEVWTALAWVVYAVLVVARFGVHQSARSAALSAVGGFAFLAFAVIGVGLVP